MKGKNRNSKGVKIKQKKSSDGKKRNAKTHCLNKKKCGNV